MAIGYTKDYYIIKNSWGLGWGIAGYIYLGRNNNECGITEHAFIIEEWYYIDIDNNNNKYIISLVLLIKYYYDIIHIYIYI